MGIELFAILGAILVAAISAAPAWVTARRARSSSDAARNSSDRARMSADIGAAAILQSIDNLDRKLDTQGERLAGIEMWAKLHDREHGKVDAFR